MKDDLNALSQMIYSGRGVIVGRTPSGNDYVGYSLTGRSPSSQARVLVEGKNTKTIITDVTDRKQLEEGSPALLLYPAFAQFEGQEGKRYLIASNGAQTKLIYSAIRNSGGDINIVDAIKTAFSTPVFEYDKKDDKWIDITTYEPDEPNNTPRVSACLLSDSKHNHSQAVLFITRAKGTEEGIERDDDAFANVINNGQGRLLTTYAGGNESPLHPYNRHPSDIVIGSETPEDIAQAIFAAIKGGAKPEDDYQVSAAVAMCNRKTGELETKVLNRHERGE
ncbi:IMP cyclohydrolase [Nanoarchaeota archaeon]